MSDDGIRFVIADKNDTFLFEMSDVTGGMDVTPNGIPTAEFTIDEDDEALADVWANGARCWWFFRGREYRGIIQETPRDPDDQTVTASVVGDARKLWQWLGWPKPTAALNAQNVEYWRMTGPTETVVKAALSANFTRLGVPWTCAPSQGRGPNVTLELRMHKLGEKIAPLLDAAGLSLTLTYPEGGGTVVDVRSAQTVPGVFSEDSGVPGEFVYNRIAPTATRAVVGGRGEGVERQFKQVIDADREESWNDIVEVFVDARNTDEAADIADDGRRALVEGDALLGVAADLAESEIFRYGETYVEGDLVTVALGPVVGAHVIEGVSVTQDPEDGVVVTPRIGAVEVTADSDERLARALARLAQGLREQGRR